MLRLDGLEKYLWPDVAYRRQPSRILSLRPELRRNLIVRVEPGFPGNLATMQAATSYPNQQAVSDGLAYKTASSTGKIVIPAASIPSGSDVTALVTIRNYQHAGSNPGFWRSGNYFFIISGSNIRPWIRWPSDIFLPSSGPQLVDGQDYNLIYRIKSGSVADCWINGLYPWTAGTPGATPALSMTDFGYQNATTENLGSLGPFFVWTRFLDDATCQAISANLASCYELEPINIWMPTAAAGSLDITGILGTATASGFTANVDRQLAIAGSLGTATASGFTANIDRQLAIAGSLGTATANGFDATIQLAGALNISGTLGTAAADGFNANIDQQIAIAASLGQSVADGFAATISGGSTTLTSADLAAIDALITAQLPNIAAAVLAAYVEGTTTVQQALRLYDAVLGGKVIGAGTSTETFRDLADTKDRIIATVDSNGNRTAITRDLS